jgi:hypothetical protein
MKGTRADERALRGRPERGGILLLLDDDIDLPTFVKNLDRGSPTSTTDAQVDGGVADNQTTDVHTFKPRRQTRVMECPPGLLRFDGRPSAACSRRKTLAAAHTCGRQATGYGTG